LGCPDGELSIVLVDDQGIQKLNKEYLNRDRPTNVISFPMRNGTFPTLHPHLLGDIVLSVETARKESAIAGISTERRLYELLIHGILHLFGYDHETSPEDALRMEEKSNALLERIYSHSSSGLRT